MNNTNEGKVYVIQEQLGTCADMENEFIFKTVFDFVMQTEAVVIFFFIFSSGSCLIHSCDCFFDRNPSKLLNYSGSSATEVHVKNVRGIRSNQEF